MKTNFKIGDLVHFWVDENIKGIIVSAEKWDCYYEDYSYSIYWLKEKEVQNFILKSEIEKINKR